MLRRLYERNTYLIFEGRIHNWIFLLDGGVRFVLTLSLQLIISSDFSENSKNCYGHKYFWSFGFPSGPLRRTSIFEASQKAKEEWKLAEKLGTSSPSQPLPIWRPAWDLIVHCLFAELSRDNMATGRLDDIENIFNSRGINKGTVWLKLPSKLIKGTWLTLEIV